jgi:NUMOD3 motif
MVNTRNPMYGRKHSAETKKKQREVKLGKYNGSSNPMFQKSHSKEAREKMAMAKKDTIWVTDGNKSIKLNTTEPIPEGFVRGRKLKDDHYFTIQF